MSDAMRRGAVMPWGELGAEQVRFVAGSGRALGRG